MGRMMFFCGACRYVSEDSRETHTNGESNGPHLKQQQIYWTCLYVATLRWAILIPSAIHCQQEHQEDGHQTGRIMGGWRYIFLSFTHFVGSGHLWQGQHLFIGQLNCPCKVVGVQPSWTSAVLLAKDLSLCCCWGSSRIWTLQQWRSSGNFPAQDSVQLEGTPAGGSVPLCFAALLSLGDRGHVFGRCSKILELRSLEVLSL